MANTSRKSNNFFRDNARTLTLTLATILMVIGALSFWITNNIYDSQQFSDRVTDAVSTEETRGAIAREITGSLYAGRPIAQQLIGDRTTALVTSLLDTDQFRSIFSNFALKLNSFLVSRSFEPIVIDISGVITPLNTLVSQIAPDSEFQLKLENVNPQITLLSDVDLPNFKAIGQTLLIVGPLAVIGLLVIAIIAWQKDKRNGFYYLADAASVILIGSFVMFILTYTSGSLLTIQIIDPERSQIMGQIYNSFISNLRNYLLVLLALGTIAKLIAWYKLGSFKRFARKFS